MVYYLGVRSIISQSCYRHSPQCQTPQRHLRRYLEANSLFIIAFLKCVACNKAAPWIDDRMFDNAALIIGGKEPVVRYPTRPGKLRMNQTCAYRAQPLPARAWAEVFAYYLVNLPKTSFGSWKRLMVSDFFFFFFRFKCKSTVACVKLQTALVRDGPRKGHDEVCV